MNQINYLAVFVCAAIAMVIGSLWFSPLAFGNPWMKGVGLNPKEIQKADATKAMTIATVNAFIGNLVLAAVVVMTQASGFSSGAALGALVSIGLIGPVLLTHSIYERKGIRVWLIYTGYQVLQLTINGGILATWK